MDTMTVIDKKEKIENIRVEKNIITGEGRMDNTNTVAMQNGQTRYNGPTDQSPYNYEGNRKTVYDAVSRLQTRYLYRFLKRGFDILASFSALIILSPVILILVILIFIDDPHGSPIYVQKRIGWNGKEFNFYKLRSMYVDAESHVQELRSNNTFSGPVFKMENDPRITRVGRFIRKTTLDETPQFVNVIKGDMSLVGPRPPVKWEADEYTPFQRLRFSIKPGLTCYWQIAPRKYEMDFNDYVLLDIKYMKDMSILTDLRLMLKTVAVVINVGNE